MATTYDYGHDLSCTDDLTAAMVEVDGLTTLAQALYRRLITPRGGLIDDPNYGFDASSLIDEGVTNRKLALIASQIDAELVKDERVRTSKTTGSWRRDIGNVGAYTTSTLVTTADGPFSLVLSITDVSVSILSISR